MLTEKKPLTAAESADYTPLSQRTEPDTNFPTRNLDNKRIEISDLFTHFTASIMQQDTLFTR
jgi:hypothetical protein